ncbi:MAG: hypothetical protein CMB00_03430 [Euryarchaeota archaeon]|nr:hypothetical protein [Euryarchaeota archaeon]DAC22981.1 MAG TPA: hypothetical protein D7H91_01435 [Candidatus Poseidoniales archaeon]
MAGQHSLGARNPYESEAVRSHEVPLVFGLSMRKILTIFGALMMLFVVVNVQFGSVAPRVIDGAEGYKLDAFLMFEPSCSFDAVEEELRSSGTSYCLGEVGQWSGADVLMLMEGLFLFVYGFELPQNKGWARRLRKVGFIMGATLCSLAVLDRFSLLPSSASSEGLATLFPFPVQPWVVQIMFAVFGVIMMRGPKYWEAEAVSQTRDKLERRREKAGAFRSSFFNSEKHNKKTLERTDRSRFLRSDKDLAMSRRRSKLLVMATCPYCGGAGCKKCNNQGVF